jgi:hypothetical protein
MSIKSQAMTALYLGAVAAKPPILQHFFPFLAIIALKTPKKRSFLFSLSTRPPEYTVA